MIKIYLLIGNMNSRNEINTNKFSTPKRRRLGMGRISRNGDDWRESFIANSTPLSQKIATSLLQTPERCESPALPCNQVEYMHDSGNNSVSSDIPCSPGNEYEFKGWESLKPKNNVCERVISTDLLAENEISDEMFQSKLELEVTQNRVPTDQFIQDVEEAFEAVNQSITCNLNNDKRDTLFETKDSFLLDIQTGVVVEESNRISEEEIVKSRTAVDNDCNSFYGLPLKTKELFKTYRNIETFYDWQEECLNLDAIKERRNLIYALPTSGGKTLVAEVLMLREVLNRKHNALFILPFVAIVQEKIWALSPFAVQLEFLVEEYAAGKGHLPPKKRRKRNSIYIATIEKGLALVRSLIELDRLQEIGLIVVDELHLIGEPGRGGTLETLLTTVIFANKGIQIVGMSATIGNLPDLAAFLHADVFERQFRPVELTEYVKLGDMLYKLVHGLQGLEVVPDRQLTLDYSAAARRLDPDGVCALVAEGRGEGGGEGEGEGEGAVLVFCRSKRNCENVAALLCKLHTKEMASHRVSERAALARALRAEGSSAELVHAVRYGVAYHHAGLAADERALLEQAYRCGVISVICCTSTLAAGVNLPARRVVIRAPYVGRAFLSLAAYRQMAGRAGRAGVCHHGESIIICPARDWAALRQCLRGGVCPARSVLLPAAPALLLSGVALRLAATRRELRTLLAATLLAIAPAEQTTDIKQVCDDVLRSLIETGVLELADNVPSAKDGNCYFHDDTRLVVSKLGNAAIKGCMELGVAKQLLRDLEVASRSVVLMGSLHLLYLVTPHDAAAVRPDYRHYYSLYSNLNEEGVQTARILGINEMNAVRMMTGKPITNVSEIVLSRFYVALMLYDLWHQVPLPVVADKYMIARGTVQSVMVSAASFAASAARVCAELEHLWPFRALLEPLALRLRTCAAPDIEQLMDLPAVKKARALQLSRAGYKRIEDLAKVSAEDLMTAVAHLSRTAASHIISAARMMLIEKVENLRAEAEDVMEELKM